MNNLRPSSFGLGHHQTHHHPLANGESSSANLTSNISSSDVCSDQLKMTHDNCLFMNGRRDDQSSGYSSSVLSDQTIPYCSLIRKSTLINNKNGNNHVSYYFNKNPNINNDNDDDDDDDGDEEEEEEDEVECTSSSNPSQTSSDEVNVANNTNETKKECRFFV